MLFFLFSVVAVLTPGPTMLTILGHSLSRGARATLPVVLGNVAGAILLMAASVAGLSTLLAALPHGLLALKIVGGVYLGWLGLSAILAVGTHAEHVEARGRGFLRGVSMALSNPKALLFFGAVMPQFIRQGQPVLPQFATMAGTFAALELVATTLVALAAQSAAPFLRRATVIERVRRAGGVIMVLAALLVLITPVRP